MLSVLTIAREALVHATSSSFSRAAQRARPLVWAAGVLVAACGGSGGGSGYSQPSTPTSPSAPAAVCTLDSAQATAAVAMQNIAFVPSCIKVAPGTTVTFTNHDSVDHTVTTDASQAETFDSGVVAPGSSYQHTFSTVGVIGLYCKIHGAMMHATVIVDPSVPAASTASGSSGSTGGMGGSGSGGSGSGGYGGGGGGG